MRIRTLEDAAPLIEALESKANFSEIEKSMPRDEKAAVANKSILRLSSDIRALGKKTTFEDIVNMIPIENLTKLKDILEFAEPIIRHSAEVRGGVVCFLYHLNNKMPLDSLESEETKVLIVAGGIGLICQKFVDYYGDVSNGNLLLVEVSISTAKRLAKTIGRNLTDFNFPDLDNL